MSLLNEQAIFLQDVAKVIAFCPTIGFIVTGGELFRTPEMQEYYFKNKLSKTQKGQHPKRLAVDLNFFRMVDGKAVPIIVASDLKEIGDFWMALDPKNDCGIRWGWDTYHFERKSS